MFAIALSAAEFEFSGGGLSMFTLDISFDKLEYESDSTVKTNYRTDRIIHWFWLDANLELNNYFSFGTRICNMSAEKLASLDLGNEVDEVSWASFQYGFIELKTKPVIIKTGLLPVDRNIEPLECHFTPQKTSWTSFWKSTLGAIPGFSLNIPLIHGKDDNKLMEQSQKTRFALEFTFSTHNNGKGKTVVERTGMPDSCNYDWDTWDLIFSMPISSGGFSIKPLIAVRTCNDGCNPKTGDGDMRISFGFSSKYKIWDNFIIPFGAGFSSFDNKNTRDIEGYISQKNSTMFFRIAPAIAIGPGKLICDMKYSTFKDKTGENNVIYQYPAADLKYIIQVHKYLTIVGPRVRIFSEFYDDANKGEKYSKFRFCPEFILVLMI